MQLLHDTATAFTLLIQTSSKWSTGRRQEGEGAGGGHELAASLQDEIQDPPTPPASAVDSAPIPGLDGTDKPGNIVQEVRSVASTPFTTVHYLAEACT